MKQLVEYSLEDGNRVVIEVDEPVTSSSGGIGAVSRSDVVIENARQSLDSALSQLNPAAESILKQLAKLSVRPDEIEVEFGLKLSLQVGVIITSGAVDANYIVKLKWVKQGLPKP